MDYSDFRDKVKRAVPVRKQNCMGLKSTLDADKLVANIENAIDEALQEGHETEEVVNWMREVEDPQYIILSDLRKEIENKGKKCCFGWCPNLKSQHQLRTEADDYVHEVAELLKKIRKTHEKAPSKMNFSDFRYMVKRAVRIWKQNCMGQKTSLDVNKLEANIENAINEALQEGHETEEVMDWMHGVEYIILSDLRKEFVNKGKKCCFGWCPNLKSQHQLRTEADKNVHEVAELLKKIRKTHEKAPSKMKFSDFRYMVKRAVRVWKQNCMGQKSSLDVDKLEANIENVINEALQEGHETEEVVDWMHGVEYIILSDLREEFENKGKKCCIGWCPNLKSQHQLSREVDKNVHEVAELLKKIRKTHEKAPSKMNFSDFRNMVKRAVSVWKPNCMGLKFSLDADKLVANIENAIDEALQEGHETEEVMNWMRRVEDLESIILSDLREEFENKGKKCCFWWCPNLKSQHQLRTEADEYVHEVAELLKKIRKTYEKAPSKTNFSYFRNMVKRAVSVWKQNCMGLKSSLDVDKLVDNIENAIDEALQEGHETEVVMNWMRKVEDQEYVIRYAIIKEFENEDKKCCFWWCPNLKPRGQLLTEADKYVREVVELLKKIRKTHEEALSKTEQRVAAAAVKDFVYFDSRSDVWEEIMVALQSPRISRIGVYGEAGVGKTMLVEEIKRKAEQLKLFDDVVMAKVTNNPDMRRIQDDISHDLDVELPERVRAADRLKSRLIDRKVLVILDDIWARIDLEEVGIPFGNKHKLKLKQPTEKKNEEISSVKEQTGCILLMTSRDSGVLSRDMHAHKIIEVRPLKPKEARELFEKIGGEQAKNLLLQRTTEIDEKMEGKQSIAEIVKEFNQLPITIATLASTLKEHKSLIQWRTTMNMLLQRPTGSEVPSLRSAIKLRYSGLQSKQLKQTFLLCSLMGHNAGIQDLLKYGLGLGLFPKATSTEKARDEVLKLVKELRRSPSLLQEGGDTMHFDMHDLIQKVAISIASREHGLLDLREDAAEEMFDKKAMKECEWIYISNGDATLAGQLPHRLKCPKLTFFYLANKYPHLKIEDKFFRGAEGLTVLGLTKMHFSSIPSSFSLLKNLRTLCLDQSKLATVLVSIMENLKNLEVLSLVGCDIEELPRETEQLAELKLLDLSDCTKLKVIRPGILKSLSQLEALYLGNSFDQWEDIKKHDNRRNASLDELTQLKRLTSLEVRIPDINMIPDDFLSIKLQRYKIFIGDVWNHWGSSFEHSKNSKILKLKHDGSIRSDKVKKLPNQVEELHLEKLNGVNYVFNELDQNGFHKLKCLHVKNIDLETEHLFFNPKEKIYSKVLPKLEVLFLHSLNGLQKIFHGRIEKPSLEKLRIITVTGCSPLQNLFSFSVAKQLHDLQEIRVTKCSEIVEIVDDEEEEDANVLTAIAKLAAQIQCLRLQHLTGFFSFSQEKIIRSRSSLLFNKKLLEGDRIWHLKKLIIEGCDQLENLFFESIVKCLEKLEHLEIRECKKMREIIVGDAGEGMFHIFRSLKQLAIENCPELKGFVEDNRPDKSIPSTALFHDNVDFFTLETMSISKLKNLNIIWREFDSDLFYRLNFLHIKDFPNLIRLCQNREDRMSRYSKFHFQYLEQLIIENCPQLNGPLFDDKFVCPNLKIMTISHLKNLKIIWENPDEDSFCNLRSLRVTYCQNLSTIDPCNSDMLKKLLGSLKELEIIGCSSVKQVFELGQSEEHKLTFQQLKVITIADCPNMATFASTFSRDQGQETSEPFFSTKFVFPNLERMTISHLKSLKIIWKNLAEDSFCNLRSLEVTYCQNLSTIFPSNSGMLEGILGSLQELEIIGCSSVKQVFELEQSDITRRAEEAEEYKLIFQRLKVITISDCPNMVTFASTFSRDQEQETSEPFFSTKVKFPNLELLIMDDCHRFKYLMTLSTVQSCSQLKKLVISGCKKMEEVIVRDEFTEEVIVTDELTEDVRVTEELIEENRISLFPKLNSMELEDLPKLTRFCSKLQNLQATTLFVFPEVTDLKFSKLPKLTSFLPKNATEWPELTNIHVLECDQVQIFALEFPSGGNQIESRTQQHPLFWVKKGLEEQEGGSRSSTIGVPAVSFGKLRTLEVSRCHGLVTILRYTIAKRLDQLSTMSIIDCSKLEEIVACEGNEVKDEIVFTQLTSLRLAVLSRLESFCSAKCNFNFPSLREVILSECPEMTTFSKGVVKTEKLQKVKLTEEDDVGIWKDRDLNSSIQHLFINKNTL